MPSLCPCHPCVHAIPVSMPSRGLRHERGQRGRREREWSAQRRGRGSGGQRERGRRRSRRRNQEEEAEKKGDGRAVSEAAARRSTTGRGTRGMRIRYCPLGCELNPTARGPPTTSTSAEAHRLQRGGAPRRSSAAASPDPREVRRGHSSFPLARGLQYCIRGRHRPRARSLCARSACGPENRGRLGRGAEQGPT